MKILFSGCSFTYGAEIEKNERFSYLVSEYFGAEEINIAEGGRGNVSTALLTITEAEKQKPDYIVINITFPQRSFFPRQINHGYRDLRGKHDNDIVNIVDNDWHENVWRLQSNSMHGDNLPMGKEIEQVFPLFRNDRHTFMEMMGTIYLLKSFSEQSGIPMCIFSGPRMCDVPIELNHMKVEGTVLEYPPKIPQWLDFGELAPTYIEVGMNLNDMMPRNHPGPIANKYAAERIIDKIKTDLNI